MPSSVWKGQLTFGLVSFPVRLLKAARKERVALKYVKQAKSPALDSTWKNAPADDEREPEPDAEIVPVRQAYVAGAQEGTMPARDLQRAFAVAPEQYVVIQREEIRTLRSATSPNMQILRSVRMSEIDPVFLETSYYVVPDTGGERSCTLFHRALLDTGLAALAQVAMHGREHIMIVRAASKGLIAHTMYYVNEIREAPEYSNDVAPKELDLAKRFVEAIEEPFRPEEFTDKYRERLEALIASKDAVRQSASPPDASRRNDGKVVDIMEALRKSLETTQLAKAVASPPRKPVSAAQPGEARPRKRKA